MSFLTYTGTSCFGLHQEMCKKFIVETFVLKSYRIMLFPRKDLFSSSVPRKILSSFPWLLCCAETNLWLIFISITGDPHDTQLCSGSTSHFISHSYPIPASPHPHTFLYLFLFCMYLCNYFNSLLQ